MGIQYLRNFRIRGVPLWIIGVCGLVGIFIDIDHPISYWVTGTLCSPAHTALGIVSCCILGGIGAYYCRLWFMVLRRRKNDRSNSVGQ